MIAVGVMESIEEFCRSMHVIVAAYVFGSSATGKDRCGNDIDIAIMISKPIDGLERV